MFLYYFFSGCKCNGYVDTIGEGGECTDSSTIGKWCYVDKGSCKVTHKYDGMFTSTTPCKTSPSSPCVCTGEKDFKGRGASCGSFCYVDEYASCPDRRKFNGKMISTAICKKANLPRKGKSRVSKTLGKDRKIVFYPSPCCDFKKLDLSFNLSSLVKLEGVVGGLV